MTSASMPSGATPAAQHAAGKTLKTLKTLDTVDLLKAVAVQLIILHHLAFYGPMADYLRPLAPDLIDWFSQNARIAVQAFLVTAGFLAAKSLSPLGHPGIASPFAALTQRYLRLTPPFMLAVLLAIAASTLAGRWMSHDSISPTPPLLQLLAHGLLLHGVLGYESVLAGAWYVAIDFQLYAIWALLLWLCAVPGRGQRPLVMPVMVTALMFAALMYFNRDAQWDAWGLYFFGSYGLGILAWWAGDPARKRLGVALLWLAMVLPVLLALAVEFRTRIAVALVIACVLALWGRSPLNLPARSREAIQFMGKISYSVFLVHYPVCLVVNAAFTRFAPAHPLPQGAGVLCAWLASLAAGTVFCRWVETPLARLWSTGGGHQQKMGAGRYRMPAFQSGDDLLSRASTRSTQR